MPFVSSEAGRTLPVLPVRDMVLFPGVVTPLFVGRPLSLLAVEEAIRGERKLFVVAQKDMTVESPAEQDLFRVGMIADIIQMVRLPDGTSKVLVEGAKRGYAREYDLPDSDDKSLMAFVLEETESPEEDIQGLEPLRRSVVSQFERYVSLHPKIPAEILMSITSIEKPENLADLVSSHLTVKIEERQDILETRDLRERLEKILRVLLREVDILEMEHSIHERVRKELEKGQKEFYLREQMKVIQNELGQGEGGSENDEMRKRILDAGMPEETLKKALHELDRLSRMPVMSAEATVVRTYLDWMVALPWNTRSRDRLDIPRARRILEEDHYALEDPKERILEYLAVRKQAGSNMRSQVLCFVGPPGVGKTSLGQSIARALGREFVNISLGGVRDEAEIRGHRRTYIGALPGRIIQKIRQAGARNPVMLLDEVDKIGVDFRGDPAAALLEVLDSRQNHLFTDHFLEAPFDLSSVMFITTANVTHTIPGPLLDRMEVIRLPGYVMEEKIHIARKHLVPRIMKEHGLKPDNITFTIPGLKHVVSDYTREAGVRNLDRQISRIVRKITRRKVEAGQKSKKGKKEQGVSIGVKQISRYLGPPGRHRTLLPAKNQTGAVVGLAWTESGGDVLCLEAVTMPGKGKVLFTGNLGDIMQESGQAAWGYLRSKPEVWGFRDTRWDSVDIHVHVPEGAIPKDGPSAGITIATAMYSALTGTSVRCDVAMTGEITLRGQVLAIGGVREKILAAKRNDIPVVIVPEANRQDVRELPAWVLKGLTLHYAETMEDVLAVALEKEKANEKPMEGGA